MSENQKVSRGSKRKLTYFVAFIVLLFGGLSAGWYWASGKLDERAKMLAANLASQGKNLDCINQEVRGYPFRLGVFCDGVTFDDASAGVNISGKGFRSAAQLYRPGHFVAELDSPYDVVVPGLAPLTIDWNNLKSSSNIGTSGFKRLSVVADQISVSANDFGQRDLLGSVQELQFHSRISQENDGKDMDIALSADQWQIDDNEANLIESVSFRIDGQLNDGVAIVQSGQTLLDVLKANGGRADLKGFVFSTKSGGMLKVSGPIEISRSGFLSGALSLDIENPQKLINYATSVFPPIASDLENVSQYLEAFADRSNNKIAIKDLKIQIKDGNIFVGFLQVGEIPRLF
jgi:hypothetical protein